MNIILKRPFRTDSAIDPHDAGEIKRALNRLGYYTPTAGIGMSDIPDRATFVALKKFQKDHDLKSSGTAKPGDDTEKALNNAMQEQDGQYIWHTAQDGKVRPEHAEREGQVFEWRNPPEGGHPKEDHGCRCWVELISDIEREELPPPNIPGTNTPDKGFAEGEVDPDRKIGEESIDPDMEKKPQLVDPYMPTTIHSPGFNFRWHR